MILVLCLTSQRALALESGVILETDSPTFKGRRTLLWGWWGNAVGGAEQYFGGQQVKTGLGAGLAGTVLGSPTLKAIGAQDVSQGVGEAITGGLTKAIWG